MRAGVAVLKKNRVHVAVLTAVFFLALVPLFLDEAARASFAEYLPGHSTEILFTGDAMFDRTVRTAGEERGYEYVIEPLLPTFKEHDLVVMNIEGPITSSSSLSQWSKVGDLFNMRFTMSPEVAELLGKYDIIAHLGNNHIWDFGAEGIRETEQFLTAESVDFFGDSNGILPEALVQEVDGVQVGFVSYNEFAGGSRARAFASLAELNDEVDFLVLYTHWGNEYETTPRQDQTELARQFVDAGADIVVGSHPHVVQTAEEYKGVPIYYSLGNLVFDQYWEKNVRCGALLSVEIRNGKVKSHELIPVRMEKSRQTTLNECK